MTTAKRILSMGLLAAALLATVACGDSKVNDKQTEGPVSDTEAVTDNTEFGKMPEIDYKEATFNFMIRNDKKDTLMPESEDTSDVLNAAIHNRNLAVEDKYNITINPIYIDGTWNDQATYMPTITQSIMAGDGAYDLIDAYGVLIGSGFGENCFMNLLEIPELKLDQPWWSAVVRDGLTVNGKLFAMAGDISTNLYDFLHVMLYSKSLASEFDMENFYDLVRDGKWTIGKMQELTKDIYKDLNQDNKVDGADRFGIMFNNDTFMHALHTSFDLVFTGKNADGSIYLDVNKPETVDVSDMLREWIYDSGSVLFTKKTPLPSGITQTGKFDANEVLFWGTFLSTAGDLRDMNTDFGVLPYPKYDEEQENYYTAPGEYRTMLVIPTDVKDLSFAGTITEALTVAGHEMIVPVYKDKILTSKNLRDEDSYEMVGLIRDSMYIDFVDEYAQQTAQASWSFRFTLDADWAFSTLYASNEKAYEKAFEDFIEAYYTDND